MSAGRLLLPMLAVGALLRAGTPPAVATNPLTPFDSADPTVWRDGDGTWYSTSTSLRLLTSPDGVRWRKTGRRVLADDELARVHAVFRWLWAPDVVKLPDGWRLYVSYVSNARYSAIAAYRGASAKGPFTFAGILTDARETGIKDTIDPEVVRDPDTGKTWLFFGSTGRIHRLRLTDDGLAPAPDAKPVLVGGLSDEGVPNRQQVYEGTYLLRRRGWWYLFASRGWYRGHTYGIVVARGRTLEGPFLDREGRAFADGHATVILRSDRTDAFFGPGHNGEVFTDAEGRDWMYFHCHVRGPTPEARPLFRQRLYWTVDGWPYFENDGKPSSQAEAPTTENQP